MPSQYSTHVLRLHCNPDVDLGAATLFDKRAHNHIIYSSRTVPPCRLGWLSHCGCYGYNFGARFRTERHAANAPVQNVLGIAREQIDHAAIQCGCSTDALVPAILWDTVSSALENGRVVSRVHSLVRHMNLVGLVRKSASQVAHRHCHRIGRPIYLYSIKSPATPPDDLQPPRLPTMGPVTSFGELDFREAEVLHVQT